MWCLFCIRGSTRENQKAAVRYISLPVKRPQLWFLDIVSEYVQLQQQDNLIELQKKGAVPTRLSCCRNGKWGFLLSEQQPINVLMKNPMVCKAGVPNLYCAKDR